VLLHFTDGDIQAKAEELGLVQAGEPLPKAMRSRVVAALLEERRAAGSHTQAREPQLAQEIVVQPGGVILIDGETFPWLVATEPMQVCLNPDGVSTVRLTLLAAAVQIIKPEEKKEDRS
jgi:hypothetical protein